MKKISAFLVFILYALTLQAQHLEREDGIYYDKYNNPYTGTYAEHYENGQIKIEMQIKSGLKHGIIKMFFINGRIKEIRAYYNNLMDGTWQTWNDNDVKIGEANYSKGLKHGKWSIWDENGILRYDMNYDNGKKTGIWYIYDESGKLISSKNYDE